MERVLPYNRKAAHGEASTTKTGKKFWTSLKPPPYSLDYQIVFVLLWEPWDGNVLRMTPEYRDVRAQSASDTLLFFLEEQDEQTSDRMEKYIYKAGDSVKESFNVLPFLMFCAS